MTQVQDSRRGRRLPIQVDVNVDHPRSQRRLTAELSEISAEGCRILITEPLGPSDQLLIRIAGIEPWPARVVWAEDGAVGIEFHKPLHAAVVEHNSLQFPRASEQEEPRYPGLGLPQD